MRKHAVSGLSRAPQVPGNQGSATNTNIQYNRARLPVLSTMRVRNWVYPPVWNKQSQPKNKTDKIQSPQDTGHQPWRTVIPGRRETKWAPQLPHLTSLREFLGCGTRRRDRQPSELKRCWESKETKTATVYRTEHQRRENKTERALEIRGRSPSSTQQNCVCEKTPWGHRGKHRKGSEGAALGAHTGLETVTVLSRQTGKPELSGSLGRVLIIKQDPKE